ncbi:uncharacterized protein V1518DRAFT_413570 [Limtongia smithiae]|uniref:uncharacterized protein n=1 Tax=Limtongia smithiae TaxID=1125753 RepID=UPI0034D01DD5
MATLLAETSTTTTSSPLPTISRDENAPTISQSDQSFFDHSSSQSQPRPKTVVEDYNESIPDWRDVELSEEWISRPNSPTEGNATPNGSVMELPKIESETANEQESGDQGGTTRVSAVLHLAAENASSSTPDWKKIAAAPKDIFSPMTLERMFKPNDAGNDSFTVHRFRSTSKDSQRLRASLSRLKSELDNVSPISSHNDPAPRKPSVTRRSSDASKLTTTAKPSGRVQSGLTNIAEEATDDSEIDNRSTRRPDVRGEFAIEPSKQGSPRPPQQENFSFSSNPPSSLRRLSTNLIPQQRHGLLFHLPVTQQNNDNERHSNRRSSITTEVPSIDADTSSTSVISPIKERTPKRARLETTRSVTTQDFLSQAENLMNFLRTRRTNQQQSDSITSDDIECSQRQSQLTNSESTNNYDGSLPAHSARSVSNQSFTSEVSESHEPLSYSNIGTQPPRRALYFDSIRNRYETSSVELGDSIATAARDKRTLADIGLSPPKSQNSPRERWNNQAPYAAQGLMSIAPAQSHMVQKHTIPLQDTRASSTRSSTTTSSGRRSIGSHEYEQMQNILPEQVSIPSTYGSMVFDDKQHRWIRQSRLDIAAPGHEEEEDVFKDIDDLTDGVNTINNRYSKAKAAQEAPDNEYRNSLQRSLSSLEEALTSSSSGQEDNARNKSPQKHHEYTNIAALEKNRDKGPATLISKKGSLKPTTRPEVSFRLPSQPLSSYSTHTSPHAGSHLHEATNVSLLDSSFSIAVHNLVKVLSDLYPSEMRWEDLAVLDLHGRGLETLVRLSEWCPNVVDINMNDNHLAHLTGAPSTTRTLRVARNSLSQLTAFGSLVNLQYLDLSENQIETLDSMKSLVHLRELIVNNNELVNINGIMQLDGLIRLSVQGNKLDVVDFDSSSLTRLEELDMSASNVQKIIGLERLTGLSVLNLDNNKLRLIESDGYLSSMRTLKACKNMMTEFDAGSFPNLRVLYLDDNCLRLVTGLRKLRLLENFSIRDQRNTIVDMRWSSLNDARKLYLSGSRLRELPFNQHFLNLLSLELASVQLKSLPAGVAMRMPNLRDVNLSFNELTDVSALKHIFRLRRLYVIGNQIDSMQSLANVVRTLPSLQVLDVRMNPLTLHFYAPVITETADKDSVTTSSTQRLTSSKRRDLHKQYTLLMSRAAQAQWEQRDSKFVAQLSATTRTKRQAYQGLMFACAPGIAWLDGAAFEHDGVAEVSRVLEKVSLQLESKAPRAHSAVRRGAK